MGMTLYNIAADMLRILDELEENGGELTPELEEALALTSENFDNKAVGYIEAARKYRDLAANSAERIKEFQRIKKTAENTEKRLKERLLFAMQAFGDKSREVGEYKISIRNSVSVFIEDEENLLPCYLKTTTAPDKTAIADALKSGIEVAGARLETNQTLNIR